MFLLSRYDIVPMRDCPAQSGCTATSAPASPGIFLETTQCPIYGKPGMRRQRTVRNFASFSAVELLVLALGSLERCSTYNDYCGSVACQGCVK